jgi:hypothetical protein
MESTDFTNVTEKWWFNGDKLDGPALELRKDIGRDLGHPRESEWYLVDTNLLKLYETLEGHNRDLLTRVDEATDDRTRLEWLQDVAALLNRLVREREKEISEKAERPDDDSVVEAEPDVQAEPSVEPSPAKASSAFGPASGTGIPERLQPAVDDLAAIVAEVVATVPGAEDLSAEELTQLVAEVLAGN